MEIVGYALIKKNATTGKSAIPIEKFQGEICRVFEFAADGGALVMDREATGLAMFDKEDIRSQFKCCMEGQVVCPPELNIIERWAYAMKCLQRKGGYNQIMQQLVVVSSINRGAFDDRILWAKQ